ncbi:MAG: ABC transporter ATP-binding protein [Clostridia bacterium]|nr:ABC transporter ATP-binding protein [Clostridia bacterium]
MAGVTLKNIYKVYAGTGKVSKKAKKSGKRSGDFVAVKDFSMEIKDGEFIVFVGPSGCGKSTTLRMIAGLEEITSGELYIGDRLVNDVDAKDRDIAMVFQSYALYPHLNAYDNIAFGLRIRKIPVPVLDENGEQVMAIDEKAVKKVSKEIAKLEKKLAKNPESESDKGLLEEKKAELEKLQSTKMPVFKMKHMTKEQIDEKVQWAAKILGIEELLYTKPAEMSGGQRQRIALGRAMVRGPKVFLLDEPLSNLDAKLRTAMRSEIVKLHNQLKTTFIYVTHDQIEAMTMGTRIVVMKLGIVQQIDTPTNLFDYPENKFVAGFIGTPQMNFLEATIKKYGKSLIVKFANEESIKLSLDKLRKIVPEYLDGKEHQVWLGIRGENLSVAEKGLSATLSIKEVLGNTTQLFVKMGGSEQDSIVSVAGRTNLESGDKLNIAFDEKYVHLFDRETEISLMGKEYGN